MSDFISLCPGHETSPNLCRCPCDGCKYHCAAPVPPDATVIGNAAVRIRNAEKEQTRTTPASEGTER